jgi:uncharacterized protein YndB with AHSA1/START domain
MNEFQASTADVEFTRVFDAPRELVFACMTRPEHLTHFWGPRGTSAPLNRIHVDLRPTGRFETVMVNDSDGSEYLTRAIYLEVVEPELLVWKDENVGMTVTAIFVEVAANRTEVCIRQTNVPEVFRSEDARAGFLTSLDRLASHLDRLSGQFVIDSEPRSKHDQ